MTQDEIRTLNQATVEKYLAVYSNERAALFTEDALCVYPFCGDTINVPGIRGRDRIYETLTQGMKIFHPFEYFDKLIFFPSQRWSD